MIATIKNEAANSKLFGNGVTLLCQPTSKNVRSLEMDEAEERLMELKKLRDEVAKEVGIAELDRQIEDCEEQLQWLKRWEKWEKEWAANPVARERR